MLRDGIPLEGALKRLCQSLRKGDLREEMTTLAADLEEGTPLAEAVERRSLPLFYKRMLVAGTKGQQLPPILVMLADHYQEQGTWEMRLKGLLVYPLIMLVALSVLSSFLLWVLIVLSSNWKVDDGGWQPPGLGESADLSLAAVAPTVLLWLLTLTAIGMVAVPGLRNWIRWRLPGFKEIGLARMGETLSTLLRGGCTLKESIVLLREMEGKGTLAGDLSLWEQNLESGRGRFEDISEGSRAVPPLFRWIVAGSGEDLAEGLEKAGALYHERSRHYMDLVLFAALPVAVLVLGLLILGQMIPLIRFFFEQVNWLFSF